jgi:acyl-coenzyme A synthetase/AMP-(fatty) acid ligase
VETAALAYGGVVEAAAYGIAGATGEPGEREVALAVVWAGAGEPDPAGLDVHLRGHLPAVAVPAVVHVLDELPVSPGSGKVQKLQLPGALNGSAGT